MTPQHDMDFETLLINGLVYSKALALAEAWQAGDVRETERIVESIRGDYGDAALRHIGDLAAELVLGL
jgi:hypothetical protein